MTVMSVGTDTTQFRFGTQSLKVTTGDTGSNALYPSTDNVVVPGLPYVFSCYIKTNAPITGGSLRLDVCAGGTITPPLFSSATLTDSTTQADAVNGWTRVTCAFTPAGGTLLVRPVIKYTGTTLGLIFWVDGVKFEAGTLASTWQQNMVSKQLVLDQGAVQVDAAQGGLLRLRGLSGGARDTMTLGNNGLLFGGDTEVSSPNAGELKLLPTAGQDKTLTVETASAKLALLKMQVTGDTNPRMSLRGDATVTGALLGPGNAAQDIYMRRSAAKTLVFDTDGALGALTAVNLAGATPLKFSTDAYIRRSGTKTLMLDSDGAGTTLTAIDAVGAFMRGFSGTSFPASPTTNDRFYRTDHGQWFHYDGTRWVTDLIAIPMANVLGTAEPLAATTTGILRASLVPPLGTDLYVTHAVVTFFVSSGGTALGASHKWVVSTTTRPAIGALDGITVADISSGSSNAWRSAGSTTLGNLTGGDFLLQFDATKTGTPGNLTVVGNIYARIVAT